MKMKLNIVLALTLCLVATGLSGCGPKPAPTAEETAPAMEAPAAEAPATATEETAPKAERINQVITPDEAIALMGENNVSITDKSVYLVDVRTPEEYAEGHIPMSLNMPLDKLESIQMLIPDANKTIIVYCRSGNRSAQAAALLEQYGYNTIYDLGGIINWTGEVVK